MARTRECIWCHNEYSGYWSICSACQKAEREFLAGWGDATDEYNRRHGFVDESPKTEEASNDQPR